jgi:hypothetical protein
VVLYDAGYKPVKATNTYRSGVTSVSLHMDNDGVLRLDINGAQAWSSVDAGQTFFQGC